MDLCSTGTSRRAGWGERGRRAGPKLSGGRWIGANTPLDTLPLYVRAGSILPMTKPMDFIGEKPVRDVVLDVYPGCTTSGYLYEDDGATFDYERGAFAVTRFTWTGGKLKVTGGAASAKRFRVLSRWPGPIT